MEPCGTPGSIFAQLLNVLFNSFLVSDDSNSQKYYVKVL